MYSVYLQGGMRRRGETTSVDQTYCKINKDQTSGTYKFKYYNNLKSTKSPPFIFRGKVGQLSQRGKGVLCCLSIYQFIQHRNPGILPKTQGKRGEGSALLIYLFYQFIQHGNPGILPKTASDVLDGCVRGQLEDGVVVWQWLVLCPVLSKDCSSGKGKKLINVQIKTWLLHTKSKKFQETFFTLTSAGITRLQHGY